MEPADYLASNQVHLMNELFTSLLLRQIQIDPNTTINNYLKMVFQTESAPNRSKLRLA